MKLTYFPDVDQLEVDLEQVEGGVETYPSGAEDHILLYLKSGRLVGMSFEHATKSAPTVWGIEKSRRHIASRAREIGRRVLEAEITPAGEVLELVTEESSPESPYEDTAVEEYNQLVRSTQVSQRASEM